MVRVFFSSNVMAIFMSARRMVFAGRVVSHRNGAVLSTKAHLPIVLKCYVAVETEEIARALERYFKSGSGKAIAFKRFLPPRLNHR